MEFQFSLFHSTTYKGTRGTERRLNIFPYIQYIVVEVKKVSWVNEQYD